ncbi:hypothetical protein GpartN1_g4535.t1 [Galdieria partita]|uniref:Proteasome activator subunit 4 n=1 Tax=Galdieria partita TaxID=83374 RepID=A0A9C7UR86_9RHOD|nr:hypothetical protein GpartN1_g4535.t1 [Galdieria partita]
MEGIVEWQKPSEALPSSYKSKTLVESKEQLEALNALAQSISLRWNADRRDDNPPEIMRCIYFDLEQLSNGTKRFLNMKLYKEFLIYSQTQAKVEDFKRVFSIWEDFSSKMLSILQTMLTGVLRREIDAVLRIKLARTATKLLEKPKILGDNCSFSPPWKETLELLEEFHVRSFDGALFVGKEVREQHLRVLVTLLLCFRYYLNSTCEEAIFSHPLFTSVPHVVPNDANVHLLEKLDWENPVKAIEQLASASLILPCHSSSILSWIPDAVSLWMKINNSHDWDRLWLRLFGRIAKQQPHSIDWSPYLHIIYDRILSCFQISTREGARRSQSIIKTPLNVSCLVRGDSVSSAAEFIVYSLTPMNPSSLDLFLQLVQIIEPFYHPNHLEHNQHFVSSFLSSCTRNLLNRLSSERKATRENVIERIQGSRTITAVAPREHRLTELWFENIVSKLYNLAEHSLYSKSSKSTQEAANSIGNLCAVLPQVIVPKVVLSSQDDFVSLTMPHRTKATLKALGVICPILSDSQLFPQGVEYILQLLPYLLPCVDINDSTKTKLAIDIVIALSYRFKDIFDDQPQVLEDFVLQWIERVIHFLENIETPAKLGHAKISPLGFDTFGNFCEVFFQNCPESLMFGLCEKISKIISASASSEALKHYGIMIFWIAKSYPRCLDSLFIKPLLLQIQDSSHLLRKEDSSNEELYGLLRLMANAVRGFADSQFSGNILQVALAAMKETDRKLYKAGSRLLRSLLEGLCSTTLGNCVDSSCTQHWNIPNSKHWDRAVNCVEQILKHLDSFLFSKDPEELLRDEMCKERIFSTARTLHALQRGGRWLLAGAFDGSVSKDSQVNVSVLKGPLHAGMFGEMNGDLTTELWKKVFQRILRLIEICCKYFPDNAIACYRILSPVEMGNEAFRFDSRLRKVMNQAKNYKQSMQALVVAKYGPNEVGKNMPLIYQRWRMECLHRKRQGYCAKGGYMEPQLTNCLLNYLKEFCFSEFSKVRSRARNALICALRLTPFYQRWTHLESLFESIQTCIATCEEEKVIACLELLQHPFLIRFFTKYYYWIKKLVLIILQSSEISERHDVVVSLSSLFGKFLSQVHPLILSSKTKSEMDDAQPRYGNDMEELQSILNMLYSVVFSSESLIWNGNWKVQAFVFSLVYVLYRPECVIPDEYLFQLMKYLCSEVMIVRAVVQRTIHLILQLSNIQQNEKWKRIMNHMLSDDSFELSLLRTLCQDLSIHDPNEQAADSSPHRNMLSATTLSLASSFFSESLDASTCWIVDGGEPWPLGYFGRPVHDLVSLRHIRLLSRLLSLVDTQTLFQVHHVAFSLLDSEQLRDQIVTPKIKHLIFGELTVALIVNLEDSSGTIQCAVDWMKHLLSCFVDADSLSTIETLFRLLYQQQPKKYASYQLFWEYLLSAVSHCDGWNHSSLNIARLLRTLFALVADQFPSHRHLIEQNRDSFLSLIEKLTDSKYLSHDFEQVREEVARLLCCLMLDDNSGGALNSFTTSTKVVHRLSSILQKWRQQGDVDDRSKKQLSNTRHTLSLLVYKCAHLRGPLHPLFDSHLVQIWLSLLLDAKEDSDVDVAAQTTNALSCCARCLVPSPNMESILMELCKENLHSSSFKVRGGTVSFFQMWIFFHFFCLSNNVFALQELLLEYLFDDSVEVREAASRSLISLAGLNPTEVLETWSHRMIHILETNDRKSGTSREDDSRIRLRHGAVLGASALILSQPFAILPWMPSLLVQVAYCIHDVPPISTCVRTMFSEFWRSHYDEWSKQKQMFEPGQLEAFNELLIAPSYYA